MTSSDRSSWGPEPPLPAADSADWPQPEPATPLESERAYPSLYPHQTVEPRSDRDAVVSVVVPGHTLAPDSDREPTPLHELQAPKAPAPPSKAALSPAPPPVVATSAPKWLWLLLLIVSLLSLSVIAVALSL